MHLLGFSETINALMSSILKLVRFERNDSQWALDITVHVTLTRQACGVALAYNVQDPSALVRWPKSSQSPSLGRELWKHTCFELFARQPFDSDYFEWNFAPSGDWGFFAFSDTRIENPVQPLSVRPSLHFASSTPQNSRLEAIVPFGFSDSLAWAHCNHTAFPLGITCVLESVDGQLAYFALNHKSDKPDFHNSASFRPLVY